MRTQSWLPDDPPEVASFDLALQTAIFPSGWQTALHRPPRLEVIRTPLDPPRARVVSLRMGDLPLKTESFIFPQTSLDDRSFTTFQPPAGTPAAPVARKRSPARRATRLQSPADVIKLQDRLYYLLQPSLESLVATGSLHFPFEPFPFQLQGIAFLYPRYSAVLADEMGLGKTMQAITTIRLLICAGEIRNILLVCPKPLVTNWQREFALWAPEIPLGVIEGVRDRRLWQWRQAGSPVKIANYELLVRDEQILREAGLQFDLVVLDEAQRIKNRGSTTSQTVRSIARSRSWALTGTPVENSTDDLVGIFEFISPGYLSSGMTPRGMARAVSDYVLRRTKDRVLTDLPPKLFRDAQLELTASQRNSYHVAETEGIVRLGDLGDAITIQHVFQLVLRLKQICNFDPVTGASSKLERLEADLEEIALSGQKAIVFSQWVTTLKTLHSRLGRFGALQYHGEVPSKRRDAVIDRFRNDDSQRLLLMSYGAGGVGLNLQFCSYVFLFDRWWNPAVEDQAINRAHRIGATGPVTISRMLMLETIEQRIDEILQQKRALFEVIFSQTGLPRSAGLSQDELFGLFKLHTPRGPLDSAS